jgi:hypothetical protein
MDKNVAIAGMFGIITIVAIVLLVNTSLTGNLVDVIERDTSDVVRGNMNDFFVKPTGMRFRHEGNIVILESKVEISTVCRNTISCNGQALYACCNGDGTGCVLPTASEESIGRCPNQYRSRCQCKEDYLAALEEEYGPKTTPVPVTQTPVQEYSYDYNPQPANGRFALS